MNVKSESSVSPSLEYRLSSHLRSFLLPTKHRLGLSILLIFITNVLIDATVYAGDSLAIQHEYIVAEETVYGDKAEILYKTDNIYINVAKPNNAGVSKNAFSLISPLSQQKIYIVNTPTFNPKIGDTPAETIVLDVGLTNPDIWLKDIEILGKKANLVIIGRNIYVRGDSVIKNAQRVVLATGRPSYTVDGALDFVEVGESLGAGIGADSGLIYVLSSGFSAPGAMFVDLVSSHILSSRISTNLRGKRVEGQVVVDKHGDLEIASGEVQISAGFGTFDYKSSTFTPAQLHESYYVGNVMTLSDDFRSGSIRVNAYGRAGVSIHGKLRTVADLTMASIYGNTTVIPDGSIYINSYGDIRIRDSLQAKNKIELN